MAGILMGGFTSTYTKPTPDGVPLQMAKHPKGFWKNLEGHLPRLVKQLNCTHEWLPGAIAYTKKGNYPVKICALCGKHK